MRARVRVSGLNLRSGPGTQFRSLLQVPKGIEVEVLEVYEEWSYLSGYKGWVSSDYLDIAEGEAGGVVAGSGSTSETPPSSVAPSAPQAPGFPLAPSGVAAIIRDFGPPASPEASGGIVQLRAPLQLGWDKAKITKFRCHEKLAATLQSVFDEIFEKGLWHLIETFDGCYNDRTVKGSAKRSTHAWGIGLDLNAEKTRKRNEAQPPELIAIFKAHGFTWGGDFKGKSFDPMHWQFASAY